MARTLIGNVKGPPGNKGITPHIGENGNWWIGETDTGIAATGSDGRTVYVSSVEDMGTYTRIGLEESKTGAVQYIEIPHGADGQRGTGILK